MKKALVYNRKSRGELEDLQKKKKELLNYCRRNDLEATYFEEIVSSVDASRQDFIKLQNKIKSGIYELLVIIDLSRLTRDLKTQLELFELLEEYGMEIHSILDGRIDPKNSSNEILLVIKGIFNQASYKEISRKMMLGRLQAAKQ